MTKDDQAPATKQDIKMLMDQMGQYYDKTDQKISGMREEIVEWKQEIKEHFDAVMMNPIRTFGLFWRRTRVM